MIENRVGNLLEQPDLTHIAHQCNLYHNFGAGIALEIKKKFPRAYAADLTSQYGTKGKLSTWTISRGSPTIFNLYTQIGISQVDRQTSYDAMATTFAALRWFLEEEHKVVPVKLGLPYKIGCGLANGNWEVVEALLKEAFANSSYPLIICRLG